MSRRKLCFFTLLTTIVASALAGRLNGQIHEFAAADPHRSPLNAEWDVDQERCYKIRTPNAPERSRWDKTFHARSEVLPPAFLPVQTKNAKVLATGKVLVASRDLADPNFVQTVVLLVHYDAQNVVGLVLNRRSDVPLSRVLKGLKAAKDRSDPVYLGGPVETPAVFGLLHSPTKIDKAEHIFGGVYLISEKTLFEHTISSRPDPNAFHVYLGYAGWTADQLKMEVALGAWFIFPGDASTVFNKDPDSLWPQMIRETELKLTSTEAGNTDLVATTLPRASSSPRDAQTHSSDRVH